jgi:cytochrome c-type biogenesis protein CcmE
MNDAILSRLPVICSVMAVLATTSTLALKISASSMMWLRVSSRRGDLDPTPAPSGWNRQGSFPPR